MTPQRPTLIDLDQITAAWSTWADTRLNPAEEVFQYDLAGNRTYVFNDANGIAQTYTHAPTTNRLTRFIQSEAGDPSDPANADYADVMPKWDNDPINNAESGWAQLSFNEPNQIGDRVIYFSHKDVNGKDLGYVAPTHSAVVVGVDECGNANLVISKWGQGPGFLHHPRDVPDSYSEQESTAVTTDNDTYSTRVYYRKQDPK